MVWKNESCCAFQDQLLPRVLPPLLLLECVLGMLGNSGALWIFCFYVKPWKSSTVFLFNLALADFLLIVILPFRASYYWYGLDWVYGDGLCRISIFMIAMSRGGSILFLTAVALDRYLRVAHPHHPANSAPVSKSVCVAVAIWLLAVLPTVYLLFSPQHFLVHGTTHCDRFIICPQSGSSLSRVFFACSFYVPLAVILFCSLQVVLKLRARQQDKRIQRALHLTVLVATVFTICFLPSNVTQLMIWAKDSDSCDSFERLDTAFYITLCLIYLNSVLDPVVYYFSSPGFRKVYRRVTQLSLRKRDKPSPAEDEPSPTDDQTGDTGSQIPRQP